MKLLKSLTLVCLLCLLGGCKKQHSSAAFSSSSESIAPSMDTSEIISSSSEESSIEESSSQETSSELPEVHYYNGYYDTLVSWTDGEDLKNQLHAIIRNGYTALSYTKSSKQNYDTNIHADHSKYDFEYLDVIYSNKHTFKTDTNKGWQREHAWCASLMCGSPTGEAVKQLGRATDFHNLFAANASGNQSRGNKNYGYVDVLATSYVTTYMSDNGNDGYSYDEFIFEPGDIDKGRLARAIFYMATMYKDDEVDAVNNINMKGLKIVEEPVSYVAGNNCAFAIGNLTDLLEWNEDNPVDYLEMQHNISVYKDADNPEGVAQGNRNPYVDYPGLVEYVYGSKKNQAGTLKDVVASASYLDLDKEGISHYALKEAKREYGYGDTLTASDYKVVGVNHNYTYQDPKEDIIHSLDNHTFTESDGDAVNAQIATTTNNIFYNINLNPMGMCSTGSIVITADGVNKSQKGVNQEVSYGGYDFLLNFETSYSGEMTINNIWSNGSGSEKIGVTYGSNNRVLSKLTITTKESYTVDSAYIKAMAGNASSSYSLTIKVGDTVVFTKTINDSNNWKVFGGALSEPLTGQVSFTFTGSASLKINSIAFNALIA